MTMWQWLMTVRQSLMTVRQWLKRTTIAAGRTETFWGR